MSLPWFPLDPGRWIAQSATAGLSLDEEGALLKLMNLCALSPSCALPDDPDRLGSLVGMSKAAWKSCWPKIEPRLSKHPEYLGQLTVPEVYEAWETGCRRSREAQAKAQKRWGLGNADSNTEAMPRNMPEQCNGNAGAMRVEKRREEKSREEPTPTPSAADAAPPADAGSVRAATVSRKTTIPFSDFWAVYPKRRGKPDAEKAWAKLNPSQELFDQICGAISEWRETEDWRKDKGQFIPYPATWLNGRRWEDEAHPDVDDDFDDGPDLVPPKPASDEEVAEYHRRLEAQANGHF